MNIIKRVHVVERKLCWEPWGEVEKGYRFDQEVLYTCMKFSKNKQKLKF